MYKPITPLLHIFLLLVLIGTFSGIVYAMNSSPSTAAGMPSLSLPSQPDQIGPFQAAQGEGWSTLQRGLERRLIEIKNDQGQPVETLHIWRLDQNDFRLDVAFSGTPKSLEAWQQQTNASMVVNGGYFSIMSEVYTADGLTVLNGKASGHSFTSGGMVAIDEHGAQLRWLDQRPYDPSEPLQAALQAFPMLVTPGGQLGFGAERDNHISARRTVIAQDKQGRILFILAPDGYFSLHSLSAYLTASDLNLDTALNLDGGGSTGLMTANPREIIPSKVLLPFVILVYEK